MVQMSERVVLPRIGDVIADVLTLLEEVSDEGESWSQMVLDFLDAFKQMRVCEKEQKHLGGQGLGGFFLYQVVLFGIRSGPLLWGRHAALLMRLTSAMLYTRSARLQCFVDDPILSVAGTAQERRISAVAAILLWLAFGCELSWIKGYYGTKASWIGAQFKKWRSSHGVEGLEVTLCQDKLDKLSQLIRAIRQHKHLVDKALLPATHSHDLPDIRRFTMGWRSHFAEKHPQLKRW